MPLNNLAIKAKLRQNGITETAFARLHGFTQRAINYWVSGERNCHLWNAMRLADALHCPLEEIWEGEITDDERAYAKMKLMLEKTPVDAGQEAVRKLSAIRHLFDQLERDFNRIREILDGSPAEPATPEEPEK